MAQANLASHSEVTLLTGPFETCPADGAFDAVVAFSAFHWIDPGTRYLRVATLLPEGGILAVADARMTLADGDSFFADASADYDDVLGDGARAAGAPVVDSLREACLASGLFDNVAEHRYTWDMSYGAENFLTLLDSFPWYAALRSGARDELYARFCRRIEARPSRTVTVTFEAVLDVARLR